MKKTKFEDDYELGSFIGRGSFGEVRKCICKNTDEILAVKEIQFDLDNEARDKAENEAEICAQLDHPSIVQLEGIYYTDTSLLLVMEYLPGGDLFDGIVSRKQYSEKDACACARQILLALAYLRKNGILHRDLKPENLLLSEKPNNERPPILKLADFGIAKKLKDGQLTVPCTASGSPMYLAPETIMEKQIDCAVDIWSCGVILYLLLVGYPPFWNEKTEILLLSILQGNYTFPSPYWDPVSESAKDLIRKTLTLNPEERITADDALQHEWIAQSYDVPALNRRTTLVRLQAFNGRRKLKAVVLGLIARKRLSYKPNNKVVKLTRRDSYVPDAELENKVQELLDQDNKHYLNRIQEDIETDGNETQSYDVSEIEPTRSHTYRTSITINVYQGTGPVQRN